MALPMPRVAPVTIAVLPFRPRSIFVSMEFYDFLLVAEGAVEAKGLIARFSAATGTGRQVLDTFDEQVDGPFGQVGTGLLRRTLEPLLPPAGLVTAVEGMKPYETDGLAAYRSMPAAVALPQTVPQVQAVLKACSALGVPVVARAPAPACPAAPCPSPAAFC